MAVSETDQTSKGGIMKLASIGNFLVIERGIVMFSCRLNGIVLWGVGLDDNPSP